jgi:guanylate kinase
MQRDHGVELSVSHTTRSPRPGEESGREYHFVNVPTFTAMRERGDFVESAEVHGNFYGTSRHWLEQRLGAGNDVLLEIDWQGARQIRASFPDAIGIFILPPSLDELERRLRGRGTETEAVVAKRLDAAISEMRHVGEFEFVIINNSLQDALDDLAAAVRASRLRLPRQSVCFPDVFRFLRQD